MANTKITTNVIADGAITSAKLDTNITISGSITGTLATAAQPNITSVGTLTGFTSTGIDDNATSTAITIDSSENVGIGTTSPQGILHIDKGASGDNITILETHSAGDSKLIFSQGQTAGNWAIGYDDGSGADENSLGFAYRSDGYPSLTTHNQMILTPAGRLGIGTTSPTYELGFGDSSGVERFSIDVGTIEAEAIHVATANRHLTFDASGPGSRYISFKTGSTAYNGTEKVRIDSSGKVGIGNSNPSGMSSNANKLVVGTGSGDQGMSIYAGTSTGRYAFARAVGDNTDAYDGGMAYDGSRNLTFHTNANSEKMRIDGSGNVGIGTTSPTQKLYVKESGTSTIVGIFESVSSGSYLSFEDSTTTTNSVRVGAVGNNFVARAGGSERMRIDSSGNLLVGATDQAWSTSSGFRVNSSGQAGQFVTITNTSSTPTDECLIIHRKAAVTNGEAIQFYRDGSSVGSITLSSGSTAYNTSSDARLKDITGSARGLEVINKLNPVAYNWKEDGRADEGLIAQEVSDIVPNAVSGTEEEMYSMDYSKLVVHLVKGMKEQQTIIDDLKTRIEALEE